MSLLKHSLSERHTLSQWAGLAGVTLLMFYAALVLAASALFLLGRSLHSLVLVAALAVALGVYLLLGRAHLRLGWRGLLAGLAALVLVGWAAARFSGYLIDLSWDGRDYHQKAILRLKEGWNPVFTQLEPQELYYNAWLNHYPRAAWIAAASLYQATGEIESGKSINLLMMGAVFLIALSYSLASKSFKPWQAALLSLLLAANPVSVYQSSSYYVDGQVSSAFILLVLLLLHVWRGTGWLAPAALIPALVIGLNLKFTATVYVLILLAALLGVSLVRSRGGPSRAGLWAAAAAGCALGLLVAGFNPYITNTIRFGHPFYPVYGSGDLNQAFIVGSQLPSNFEGQSQVGKLFLSIFSRSQDFAQRSTGPLKNPFSVTIPEIKAFKRADVRVGGWGPLFGGALLLALAAFSLAAIERRAKLLAPLGLAGLVFATCLLNPETWWARYSPQLWLVPLIALAAAWQCRGRAARLTGWLLLAVLLVNVALVSGANLAGNLQATRKVRQVLGELSLSGEPVLVYYGPLDAVTVKLDDYKIPYRPVPSRADLPYPQELEPDTYFSPLTVNMTHP